MSVSLAMVNISAAHVLAHQIFDAAFKVLREMEIAMETVAPLASLKALQIQACAKTPLPRIVMVVNITAELALVHRIFDAVYKRLRETEIAMGMETQTPHLAMVEQLQEDGEATSPLRQPDNTLATY